MIEEAFIQYWNLNLGPLLIANNQFIGTETVSLTNAPNYTCALNTTCNLSILIWISVERKKVVSYFR